MKLNFDFPERFAVAISGGADSMALLYLIKSEIRNQQSEITVLHVNHKLRDAADAEEQYVIETCKNLGVRCVTFALGKLPTANLESAARDARYRLMTDWCKSNGVDILMTAHQADDQIETFLMNLGRGSGVYGLAAMRPDTVRDGVKIVRPLLDISRADLERYCADNNIKYFNDEMNDEEKYTRVRIRKNRHVLRDRLGISDERILLAIKNLARARDALGRLGGSPPVEVCPQGGVVFSAKQLFAMPDELQLRFLGDALRRIGGTQYSPRLTSIERLIKKLENDTVATLSRCTVRRLGDKIMIVPEGSSTSFREKKSNEKTANQKK